MSTEPFTQDPWPQIMVDRALGTAWPSFAETWYGGEFPSGRGQKPLESTGWRCPGCSACWSPAVHRCPDCGPEKPPEAGEG